MKRLILLSMHGAAGAGSDSNYSPRYPWTPTDDLQEFITNNVITDDRIDNHLFQGLYWKGAIDAGKKIVNAGEYDDVKVICTKGGIASKHGKWFAIKTIKEMIHKGDDVDLVPIGKSIGGFDSLEVVDHFAWKINTRKWRRRIGKVHCPFALLIDPDDFPTPDLRAAKKVPASVEDLLVIRQENTNREQNWLPRGLCGRKMARKNGSLRGIEDRVYPTPSLTFPDSDPFFSGREVTHWTIDEHMVMYGHPTEGTIESILVNRFCK